MSVRKGYVGKDGTKMVRLTFPPHYITQDEYEWFKKMCRRDKWTIDELLRYIIKSGIETAGSAFVAMDPE